MPDIKVISLDSGGRVTIALPRFDDSVSGIIALAQTVTLMLLDPNYGNLYSNLKKRVDKSEVGEIVLRAIDIVETKLISEQSDLEINNNESLSSIEINSIVFEPGILNISLKINNMENESINIIV
ncbi:MAG: hypothetical protein WCY30_05280 [Candidatus Neomarinimicrobiota bacterium]|jgi:hypothetical protein